MLGLPNIPSMPCGILRSCQRMILAALPTLILLDVSGVLSLADASILANNSVVRVPENRTCTQDVTPCKEGLLLPMWKPQGNLSAGDKAARAIVYMAAMVYMFLGVSIVADRFMAAIEVITSKEKEIVVKKPGGGTTVVSVRIWNETVSNLTLMALGSSAPEILLSVIEICGNKFEAGDLGPSTIVGSAAYNLFVIIAICVYVVPNNEVRRIKHLRVFFITATWSVFAYVWLYFILSVTSKGIVEIWEAVLTFLFFPGTVITAYIADRKLLVYKYLSKKYSTSHTHSKGIVKQTEGLHETEMADGKMTQRTEEVIFKGIDHQDTEVREFEQHRSDFIEILRELRKKNPNLDMKTLEEMAEYEAVNRGPKSRAFYRIQATRQLTGGGKVLKKAKIESKLSQNDIKQEEDADDKLTRVFFDPGHYTVMENVGVFSVTVTREGGDLSKTLYVDYRTEDGTANAGDDYIATEGTLVFQPYEKHKQFEITILDDDIFEEDEHFYVHLTNVRLGDSEGMFISGDDGAQLVTPFIATVMILDDDHPGIFHFEDREMTITENIGEVLVKVCRSSGARGCVRVPFHAVDGTAKFGKDYELVSGEIFFDNDEAEQYIKIGVVDDEEYEKTEQFSLVLDEPQLVRPGRNDDDKDSGGDAEEAEVSEMGKPRLGETTMLTIYIKESQEFKSTVDKLLKKANVSVVVGTSSWREQFVDAITVSADKDDATSVVSAADEDEDEEEAEEKLPSCLDYVMHFLTLFWKIMFAFVPPTDYFSGWACFCVSIILIGVLTAVIGDLAGSFGCTVGLKDSVTAISFVALGTSVPDTFASKVAAINDRYADSSIGNVTGSNAVNVFLGIGIAWTIAAVYHAVHGREFVVPAGDLAMSVTVYCVMALVAIALIMARRHAAIGGELGGPTKFKTPTVITLVLFWVLYLLISAFVSYCYIPGF